MWVTYSQTFHPYGVMQLCYVMAAPTGQSRRAAIGLYKNGTRQVTTP